MVVAVSLATPVFLMFMALGTIYGIGVSTVFSAFYVSRVIHFCEKRMPLPAEP